MTRCSWFSEKTTKMSRLSIVICLVLAASYASDLASACRVSSELLKSYTRDTIESLLDVQQLQSLYWRDEPLSASLFDYFADLDPTTIPQQSSLVSLLAKATGVNVTLAETHFQLDAGPQGTSENVAGNGTRHVMTPSAPVASLIQDVFVTCSAGRDRTYTLSANLELDNPFKTIDLHYDLPHSLQLAAGKTRGRFRIALPQSSLLVQLSQRVKYDECFTINNVQLAPSVNYEIECSTCEDQERAFLDNALNKRMSQFDSELDAQISDKLLFGLHVLLNQQRLELD